MVGELARRAGVDPTPIEQPERPDRRAKLLAAFVELSREELLGSRGSRARDYLQHRGLPSDAIDRIDMGVVPGVARLRRALLEKGFRTAEVEAAGVCADSRWPGRLCGPWRSTSGRPRTIWARSIEADSADEPRYLYLRGASRRDLPPYGLSEVLASSRELRRDLVLVEGVFDVHQLRANNVDGVAALGGTSADPRTFEFLARLGVERVTLCLDRDTPGRGATARALDSSTRARTSPTVFVVDPEHLAPAKDPDELVRSGGLEAWSRALEARECGIAWRATELLGPVAAESAPDVRRAALQQAGYVAWRASSPARP